MGSAGAGGRHAGPNTGKCSTGIFTSPRSRLLANLTEISTLQDQFGFPTWWTEASHRVLMVSQLRVLLECFPCVTAPLFESKFLSSREHTDRFANALLARLRPLRRMNPGDEVTTIAGC